GTRFMGWQRQPHPVPTVQACVEAALANVANHPVGVTCAGRTDAGVHASGQVVHFDTHAQRTERGWRLGVNSNLPEDIAIRWLREVPEDFHARFRARARHYRYTIVNRETRPALTCRHATWVHVALDLEAMQSGARHLLGEHDFSAFRAVECQARSPVRTLHRLEVRRVGERVIVDVVADGFLHHMVRNIAGVLIAIGARKYPSDWARAVLQGRDRKLGGVTAPPQGLCFMAVLYPAAYGIPVPEDAMFGDLSANL
ncbi:MAG: tRNA pseudouridine(38-40) synthase TruA, partial [Gammaproteobacteria bacterium]